MNESIFGVRRQSEASTALWIYDSVKDSRSSGTFFVDPEVVTASQLIF
jgi:hypothetical protein